MASREAGWLACDTRKMPRNSTVTLETGADFLRNRQVLHDHVDKPRNSRAQKREPTSREVNQGGSFA